MKEILDDIRYKVKSISFTDCVFTDSVLEIIDEAESKWNEDVCEWQKETYSDYSNTSCGKRAMVHGIWRFCPYCGKKIKIRWNTRAKSDEKKVRIDDPDKKEMSYKVGDEFTINKRKFGIAISGKAIVSEIRDNYNPPKIYMDVYWDNEDKPCCYFGSPAEIGKWIRE